MAAARHWSQTVLVLAGLVFASYGVYCWLFPDRPADYAGLFIASHDAYAEIAAMYGGLQTGFGVALIASGVVARYRQSGLWLIVLCIGPLAAARGSVAFGDLDTKLKIAQSTLGMSMSSSFTAYTWGALAFETLLVLLALIALLKQR